MKLNWKWLSFLEIVKMLKFCLSFFFVLNAQSAKRVCVCVNSDEWIIYGKEKRVFNKFVHSKRRKIKVKRRWLSNLSVFTVNQWTPNRTVLPFIMINLLKYNLDSGSNWLIVRSVEQLHSTLWRENTNFH
jgi:hypothetical protein